MAQDKPALQPRWATSPPVGPPTDITEPTAAQKDSGWQPSGSAEFPDGKPVRQIMNWLQNLFFQWSNWTDQSRWRSSDLHPDQPFPDTTPNVPTIAAGLVAGAADFAASVYADGYRVPETDSPAHTYAATSDTYWDLGRDCVWTPSVVASGGGAPAVAPLSVRVFAVRTDAIDRTLLLIDNLTPHTTLDFDELTRMLAEFATAGALRLGANADDFGASLFDALLPRVVGTGEGSGSRLYTQWGEIDFDSGSGFKSRFYGPSALGFRNAWVITFGARLQSHLGAVAWISDSNAADVFRIMVSANDSDDRLEFRFSQIIGIGVSTGFSEADWQDANISGQKSQLEMTGGIRLGLELNQGAASTQNSVAQIEHTRNDGQARYTLQSEDKTTATYVMRTYRSANMFGTGATGMIRTINASWNESTTLWNRDDNTKDSIGIVDWEFGPHKILHESSESATWVDTLTPSTWEIVHNVGTSALQLRHILSVISGSPFAGGVQYGYGQKIRGRRIFDILEGQPHSVVENAGDSSFNVSVSTLNPGFWPATTPAQNADILIPMHLPHECDIVSAEVLYIGGVADAMTVELFADDMDDTSVTYKISLMSAGADATWVAQAATRNWIAVGGIDQNLTIDNQRFRYWIGIRVPTGSTNQIFGVRVDFDAPYMSVMDK